MNDETREAFAELERQIALFPRVILTAAQIDCLKDLVHYRHDGWDYETLWLGNGRWNGAFRKRDAEAFRNQILLAVAERVAKQLAGSAA